MGYDGSLKFDTKIDESGFNSGVGKLGTIAKSGIAVLGTYVASFGVLTKSALNEVAQLEQNVGGVETLFKDCADSVVENANRAYKTAGLSANEYMSTVTSFAAALKQSVSTEAEAAKVADQAIIDMSDNANKMGSSMESIQNAYQGFAKQNYTMLDNLKLGYGGTKSEMERLLADAEKISGIKYNIDNLADVYNAIHVIQTELGITGTTAEEAATTIEGSMNSTKAAWSNFLAGTGSAEDLASAIGTAADNIVDNLCEIVPRLAETLPLLVKELTPAVLKSGESLAEAGLSIVRDLGTQILENAPALIETAAETLAQFAEGIADQLPTLVPQALQMIVTIADAIVSNLPTIISVGISLLAGLIQGIINSLPLLIAEGPRIINDFADAIYSGVFELITTGAQLLWSLIQGIWSNAPLLFQNAGEIFMMFINIFSLSNLFNLGKNLITKLIEGIKQLGPNAVKAGGSIVSNLLSGIKSMATHPVTTLKNIATNAMNAFKGLNWKEVGSNIVSGIITGLKNAAKKLANVAKEVAGSALTAVKKTLGIKSPSRRFRDEVGKMMAVGMGDGFEKNIPIDDMEDSIDYSVQRMQKRVSNVTSVGARSTKGISEQYIARDFNQGEATPVEMNVVIENHFDVDGEELVEKTTKATIKKLNSNQDDIDKAKGR